MDMSWFNDIFSVDCFSQLVTKDYEDALNKLYWTDAKEYMRTLNDVKSKGYRVLRNEKGKHKVQVK
jgi:hypothetical protein